jgi:hypothetical protein
MSQSTSSIAQSKASCCRCGRGWRLGFIPTIHPRITFHLNMPCLAQLIKADLAAGVQRERLLFAIVMLLKWWCAFQEKRERLVAIRKSLNKTPIANWMAP